MTSPTPVNSKLLPAWSKSFSCFTFCGLRYSVKIIKKIIHHWPMHTSCAELTSKSPLQALRKNQNAHLWYVLRLWLFVGIKVLLSHLQIPRFEFKLQRARALSGNFLSRYELDVRRYYHVFQLDNISWGKNSNLKLSEPAHYLGKNLVPVNIHRSVLVIDSRGG